MSGRLLLIEARRSVGLWALLALPVWWWLHRTVPQQVAPLWNETSLIIRNAIAAFGPILGGAAAWMAGRESRHGMADLLETTAHPQFMRRLMTWSGVVAWGALAYLLAGAIVAGYSLARATWGGPFPGPILVGFVALPVYAALGFAIGRRVPGRFAAPLVAIALLVVPLFVGALRDRQAFFSPMVSLSTSVWYGVQPDLSGLQLVFLLSLGGAALATLALPTRASRRAVFVGLLAFAPLTTTTIILWAVAPELGGQDVAADPRYRALEPLPYTPVCAEAPLPVCVHPAFRSSLGETTAALNLLAAPVLGLTGAPIRAEQGYAVMQGRRNPTEAVLWFDLHAGPPEVITQQLPRSAVFSLIIDPTVRWGECPAPVRNSCLQAQAVIGRWLLQQAGVRDTDWLHTPGDTGRIAPAVERFAALDPAAQRAWLEAHFADLRAGRVSLEELP